MLLPGDLQTLMIAYVEMQPLFPEVGFLKIKNVNIAIGELTLVYLHIMIFLPFGDEENRRYNKGKHLRHHNSAPNTVDAKEYRQYQN